MWAACSVMVIIVLVQCILFTRKAFISGRRMGLTEAQLKGAVKSSAITSIGPSIVVASGLLSLLVAIGGPMAWMRLSVIGSVMFEGMAAGFGTQAVGVELGVDPMTTVAYASAIWTMILGSIGWIIFSTFAADKMERVQNKLVKGNTALLSLISIAAILGAFGALSASHLIKLNKNTVACVAGGVIMLALLLLAKKKKISWLNEWALTFAILGGMLVTLAF